jgi:hypothetical protein
MTLSMHRVNVATAYRLLTLQITLPSREDILDIANSESWMPGNGLTSIFDAIHRLAETPEGKSPSDDLFDGILNVMTFWYRWHYAEAKNVCVFSCLINLPYQYSC